MVRRNALMALFIVAIPLPAHASRLINLHFTRDPVKKSYTISLESADEKPLFTFPVPPKAASGQSGTQKPGLIDRFFNVDRRRFIFDSIYMSQATDKTTYTLPVDGTKESIIVRTPPYTETIKQMTKEEARRIVQQQTYVMQTYDYLKEKVLKTDDMTRAKLIVGSALEKLYTVIQTTLDLSGEASKSLLKFDLEDVAKVKANPLIIPLYSAIREFVQMLGCEMPTLESWYVRHRGKIVAGAGLALLAYLYYSNTRTTGVAPVKQVSPSTTQVPTQPQSLYAQTKAAAEAKIGHFAQKVVGHISKAAVADLERAHGLPSQTAPTATDWVSAYVGRLFTKQLSEAQGIIPKTINPSWQDWIAAKGVNWYVKNYGASWSAWTPK